MLVVATSQTVAVLGGAPSRERLWQGGPAVVDATSGVVAALEDAPGCAGTALYRGTTLVSRVKGATGAELAPDGSMVAFARRVGETGTVQSPGIESASMTRYDILLVESATGTERVVAHDAISSATPSLQWNKAGTHLLVRWPSWFGN